MNHAEAIERAAERAAQMDDWLPDYAVEEILDASGYPAALTEVTELLRELYEVAPDQDKHGDDGTRHSVYPAACRYRKCLRPWPCPVERARVWLTDHDKAET